VEVAAVCRRRRFRTRPRARTAPRANQRMSTASRAASRGPCSPQGVPRRGLPRVLPCAVGASERPVCLFGVHPVLLTRAVPNLFLIYIFAAQTTLSDPVPLPLFRSVRAESPARIPQRDRGGGSRLQEEALPDAPACKELPACQPALWARYLVGTSESSSAPRCAEAPPPRVSLRSLGCARAACALAWGPCSCLVLSLPPSPPPERDCVYMLLDMCPSACQGRVEGTKRAHRSLGHTRETQSRSR
jgi:hypothetical protein